MLCFVGRTSWFILDAWFCLIFFFFSSRRRHTRWTGDWSSDVCSSDLGELGSAVHRGEGRDVPPHGRADDDDVARSVEDGGARLALGGAAHAKARLADQSGGPEDVEADQDRKSVV